MASGNAFIALASEPSTDLMAVNPWNLMHLARMLKDEGGISAHGNQRSEWDAGCRHGNQRSEWDAGCRFDFPNPEYR